MLQHAPVARESSFKPFYPYYDRRRTRNPGHSGANPICCRTHAHRQSQAGLKAAVRKIRQPYQKPSQGNRPATLALPPSRQLRKSAAMVASAKLRSPQSHPLSARPVSTDSSAYKMLIKSNKNVLNYDKSFDNVALRIFGCRGNET